MRARRRPLSGRPIVRAAFPILLALGALDAAGYSMIAPVVPAISRATGVGPAPIGALVSSFAAGQLVGYPLAAGGVQRRHAAAVLAAALALMVVGDLGFIVGSGLPVYVAARFIQGIGAGGLWMGVVFACSNGFRTVHTGSSPAFSPRIRLGASRVPRWERSAGFALRSRPTSR